MRGIRFGERGWATAGVAAPRLAALAVVAAIVVGLSGAPKLRFADDTPGLVRAPLADVAAAAFADPAEEALLLVEGEFAQASTWRAFTDLVARLEAELGRDAVASILDLRALVRAAGPPDGDAALFEGEARAPPPRLDPAALARHPLNAPPLLTPALDAALVRLVPDPALAPIAGAREVRAAVERATAELPQGLEASLTGPAILRLELVTSLARQQPRLLGAGLAIGLALGVVLLGRLADALVVAVMPVVVILTLYGVLGHAGIAVTPLVNNLPLLLLALAFTTSLHLVHASRADLHAAGGNLAALRGTMAGLMPAVVLSALTTALAFLTLLAAGSDALARFGLLGAAAVTALIPAAIVVHPAVVALALRLGWRPSPRGASPAARALEAGSLALARRLDAARYAVALAALTATLVAGLAFAQARPAFSLTEDVRADTPVAASFARVRERFDAGAMVRLPLPLRLDLEAFDPARLTPLRAAHEAAVAAFPAAPVVSPWTLVDWLADTGRAVTPAGLAAVLDAAPPPWRRLLLAEDGTPALLLALASTESAAIAAAAARLETAVGRRLAGVTAGDAAGLAVTAARRGPEIVAAVARGLAAAAVGAALLLALAFRSAVAGGLALVVNLLPVLLVGAVLAVLGEPLRLASAMALTIALGIAVDGTAHLLNRFAPLRRRRGPRAALAATLRALGPVLVTSTAVLCLGLLPALASWSAGVALFAAFAIATLVFALVADLVVLPALLVLGRTRRHRRASGD